MVTDSGTAHLAHVSKDQAEISALPELSRCEMNAGQTSSLPVTCLEANEAIRLSCGLSRYKTGYPGSSMTPDATLTRTACFLALNCPP